MKRFLLPLFLNLLVCLAQSQTLTNSNLPIAIISTDFSAPIEDDTRVFATMKIIYHPDGSRNYVSDQSNPLYLNYNGRISIETRGSSSQWLTKKQYSLSTLKIDDASNNNLSVLNMPKEHDWILNGFAFDPSLMRDYLSFELARNLGNYASRGKHCEVIINGEYVGVYMLCEKLKIDENRINISRMKTTDISGVDLTGGYLTKCDKTTGGDVPAWTYTARNFIDVDFIHESPKPSEVTTQQNKYINDYFDAFVSASGNNNATISNGFPSMIDLPSFIDFMILNELAANVDGYQLSTFFHKDKNGKLRAGPIWDFNLAYGIDAFGTRSTTYDFQFDNGDNVGAKFWKDIYDNPTFHCYLVKRWNELTAAGKPLSYSKIVQTIDSLNNILAEAKVREEAKWGTIGWPDNSVSDLKSWLTARISWLNSNFTSSGCAFPSAKPLVITKIHYNPLLSGLNSSNDLEFIELTNNSSSSLDLSGFYFRELGVTYSFPNNSTIAANGKIYLASNAAKFSTFYNYTAFGEFSRNMSNSSEKLILCDAFGNVIDYVEYKNVAPWPSNADGTGAFLKLKNINLDNSIASSWAAETTNAVSIEESAQTISFNLYPNPTESIINIATSSLIDRYEVYDELGRLILDGKNVRKFDLTINLEQLRASTYFVNVILEDQSTIRQKVVKF